MHTDEARIKPRSGPGLEFRLGVVPDLGSGLDPCSSVAVLYAARVIEADAMNDTKQTDPQEAAASEPADADVAPWEELEPGRFMPRRVRGSCRGLALG
jgi:hypothetical protein